jgi:periplasmic protein TonB
MKTSIVETFDDIVFENRNQDYGAYELRTKYPKRGTIALIIALLFVSFAVGGPLIASIIEQRRNYNRLLEKSTTMEMEKIKVERDEITPPPPPPPPPAVTQIKFVAPKIVEELTEPDAELSTNDDIAKSIGVGGAVDTTTKQIVEIVDEPKEKIVEEVFESFAIQEKPMFPGGDAALIQYVAEHTKYPVIAQENGIEGTVYIRFVVTRSGEVGQATVMRAVDPLLEEEALRVVKTLPKWTPGKNNGNPVNVWFIIPVKFKLQ